MRWALAIVGVHTIHTHTTILAVVARTVIDVVLTVLTSEACRTGREQDKKETRCEKVAVNKYTEKDLVTFAFPLVITVHLGKR